MVKWRGITLLVLIVGSGTGSNRRAAEQDAATDALTAIAAKDAQARG